MVGALLACAYVLLPTDFSRPRSAFADLLTLDLWNSYAPTDFLDNSEQLQARFGNALVIEKESAEWYRVRVPLSRGVRHFRIHYRTDGQGHLEVYDVFEEWLPHRSDAVGAGRLVRARAQRSG